MVTPLHLLSHRASIDFVVGNVSTGYIRGV